MAIFAVLNQKGGVGKTTTAVTIASALARQDYSALLIDLDSQGNVADSLGLETGDDLRRLLSPDLLLPLAQVVKPSEHLNLDVIRADKTTAVLKQILAGVDLREYVLADALAHNDYDVIVFDCAPSVDLFHIAALVAADFIVIPTRLDKLAVNGVRDALQTLASLRRISHCQQARVVLGLRVVQTGPEFDPNGPRELKVLKTNLGSYQDPIGFEFAPLEPAGVMLKWDTKAPKTYREPTQRDECKEWLEDF